MYNKGKLNLFYMKDLIGIGFRLTKVIYVLFLLFGIIVVLFIWNTNSPYTYMTYNYLVTCNNGKTFDPTSKPIDKTNDDEPYSFNDLQLKSECEYGTAFYEGLARQLSKNYFVAYQEEPHIVRTIKDQVKNTIIYVVIYYFLIEIFRRTILYIFLGKRFL